MTGNGESTGRRGASRQREALVEFCRVWRRRLDDDSLESGEVKSAGDPPVQGDGPMMPLAPRLRQTLELLLSGESEKQIAGKLKLSRHTVHGYVKVVYRRFNVSTRAELLARWVRR